MGTSACSRSIKKIKTCVRPILASIIMNEFKTIEKCSVPPNQATKLEKCVKRDYPEMSIFLEVYFLCCLL